MMRALTLGLLVMIVSTSAHAAPVKFLCRGTLTEYVDGKKTETPDLTWSVTVDSGMIDFDGLGPAKLEGNGDLVHFRAPTRSGPSYGFINRITGVVSFTITSQNGATGVWDGVCKPTRELF